MGWSSVVVVVVGPGGESGLRRGRVRDWSVGFGFGSLGLGFVRGVDGERVYGVLVPLSYWTWMDEARGGGETMYKRRRWSWR